MYEFEGKGEVKFALAADGNLWTWNHQIEGMTGAVFFFCPVMGFLAGLVVVLIIIGVNWPKGKNRFNQQEIR